MTVSGVGFQFFCLGKLSVFFKANRDGSFFSMARKKPSR
jgi:hypothetical protein